MVPNLCHFNTKSILYCKNLTGVLFNQNWRFCYTNGFVVFLHLFSLPEIPYQDKEDILPLLLLNLYRIRGEFTLDFRLVKLKFPYSI